MSSGDTRYSARFETSELIEQGRDNGLRCRVYRAGSLVAPTAVGSRLYVYDATNTAVVDAAIDDPVVGSIATYTVSAAVLAALLLGEGWRVEWHLLMPDGVVHVFRNDAALVRRRLYPCITEADLYRRLSSLDPSEASVIHSETDFADKIDEAMVELENALIAKGNRPNLVMSPSSFRAWLLATTCALIFEDFATRLNEAYATTAERFRKQAEAAWDELNFLYDNTDTGQQTSTARRSPQRPVWTNGRH